MLMGRSVQPTNLHSGSSSLPLVSVGVPVRNGATTLALALDSVVNQTYPHLEIIISDNCSGDATGEIALFYANRDPRIRYYRHDTMLTALNNFRFTLEQAHGKYFMWAADDDLRSSNFVEILANRLDREPGAAMVFSEVTEFDDYASYRDRPATQHAFATTGLSLWQRINQQTHHGCMHIFGLFRADYLRDYTWSDIESGPDIIMLLTIGTVANFVYQPGAMFYYYRPPNRDHEQRARESAPNSRGLRPFHPERLAWLAATGMAEASGRIGCPRSRLRLFLYLYYQMTQGIKGIIFRWTPLLLRQVWHRLKLALAVHGTVSRRS